MSDNEKFNVSADWSANAQINQDKYNEWYETSFNNNEDFWNKHGKRIELSLIHISEPTRPY